MAARKKPIRLKQNPRVALIAPAFKFDPALYQEGRSFCQKEYGFEFKNRTNLFEQENYFAGSDQRRLDELFGWLTDPSVEAVLAVRGGYGCPRLYPELVRRMKKVKNLQPKVLVGYSDLSILLNGLFQDFGWITFHGPVLVGRPFRQPLDIEKQTFRQSLFENKPLGKISNPLIKVLSPGVAEGALVGGCLAVLLGTLGTSYEINADGRILFLEDVNEPPYKIDRMLVQLLQSGKLDKVKGIVFGEMEDCVPTKNTAGTDVYQAIESAIGAFARKKKIPVIMDFPAGHGKTQITFPIGVKVRLTAKKDGSSLDFLEAGVR